MMPQKWHSPLIKIIAGCVLCYINIIFATNWPIAPYGFLQGGADTKIVWSAPWRASEEKKVAKFSKGGGVLFAGVGILLNPSSMDEWLLGGDLLYYRHFAIEQGIFVLPKISFTRADGVENFIGIGPGIVWLDSPAKKDESRFTITGILQVGRNWHIHNGWHVTMRGSYLLPSSNRQHSLSGVIGLQCNFM